MRSRVSLIGAGLLLFPGFSQISEAQLLGDSTSSMTYTRLDQPCRIVDTRVGGGMLTPGAQRDFRVAGRSGFSAQGGNATGCGIPAGPATAVLINFIAVNPSGAGNLRGSAFPRSIPATGSIINYQGLTPPLNIANGVFFPICDDSVDTCAGGDITLLANGAATHVVADVLGYFNRFAKEEVRSFAVTRRVAPGPGIGSACTNLTFIDVIAPVDGIVVLRADVVVSVPHVIGHADSVFVSASVAECQTDSLLGESTRSAVEYSIPTGTYYPMVELQRTFFVAAGTHRFYINGKRNSGATGQSVHSAGISAAFYPDQGASGAGTGNNADDDGDGWTENRGDCCDLVTATCSAPELVNPGGYDVPGNGVDDDCNGSVDTAVILCDTGLASNDSDPVNYAKAMDLCPTVAEFVPPTDQRWGLISAQFLLPDGPGTPSALSRSIRPNFGNNSPQRGSSFTLLSTGRAAAPSQSNPSYASFQSGPAIGGSSAFPSDWFVANGSTLPTSPGCPGPQGSAAVDPIMLKLRVRVPTNARSFRVASRFFSSEYPEWVCSPFNDFFVVLLDSSSPWNPPDKNLARYVPPSGGIYPIGVNQAFGDTGLFQACENGATGCATSGGAVSGTTSMCTGTSDLTGTGFEVANPPPHPATPLAPGYCGANNLLGGGTAWLKIQGNVVPGEVIELRFAIWDTSDGYYDSLVLLDRFEWSDDPVTPGAFIGN